MLALNILTIFAFVSYATPAFSCASHCDAADTSSSSSSSEVPGKQMLKQLGQLLTQREKCTLDGAYLPEGKSCRWGKRSVRRFEGKVHLGTGAENRWTGLCSQVKW